MRLILFTLYCLFYGPLLLGQVLTTPEQFMKAADVVSEQALHEQAIDLLMQASQLYEKQGQWEAYSHTQNRIAEALLQLGKFDESLSLAQKNIKMIADKGYGENLKADALLSIGLIQLNKGYGELALKSCEHALKIYEQEYGGKHEKIAKALSRLGIVYWDLDNDQQALDYHLRALAIRKSIYNENALPLAASYNDIGLVYATENPEKALPYYQKSLKVYEQKYGEIHPKVANGYLNISYVERSQKKYDSAMEKAEKALGIWREVYETTHPNEAVVLSFIGQLHADQEHWGEALALQKQALTVYTKFFGDKHPKTANTYQLMGDVFIKQGKHKKALEYLQSALTANVPSFNSSDTDDNPTGKDYYNPTLLINTLLLKAEALEGHHYGKSLKFKDLKTAYQTLLVCDQLIEQQRQVKASKQDKIALGLIASDLYERAIRLCLAMAEVTPNSKFYREEAFAFSEKGKASVLLSAISDTKAKEYANIPPQLLSRELELKVEITSLEQKLADLANPEEEALFRQELQKLQKSYRFFIDSLEEQFPEYYNLKYNISTVNSTQLQTFLKKDQALISYYVATKLERLYVFEFTKNRFKVHDVPLSPKIQKLIVGFQNGIKYQIRKAWEPIGYDLYEQLFPKWKPKGIKHIVIVPDGILGTIPFEALVTEKANEELSTAAVPFLLKQHALSYAYSATIFHQTFIKAQNITQRKALLCAPILFASRLESHAQDFMSDLPGTQAEVNNIALTLQGKGITTEVVTKQDAHEGKMKEADLDLYRIIHLATHGIVDQEHPELSQIFLYAEGNREDGNLFASEIYNISMKADLVVFSACQTGLGKISVGEGIIGLSRALLYAGAQNIIVSLWSVSDESTSQLMQAFYQALEFDNENIGYQEAVRDSKLQLIEGEEFAEPYFWAPFILLGH